MAAVHFQKRICSKVGPFGSLYGKVYRQKYSSELLVASKCQVSLAYAIGVAEPVMIEVDTFGTGKVCG